jgi:hypothetical protein
MLDLLGILPSGYSDVEDLDRIGNTNFLYNGLNLVYSMPSYGKSWQTVIALADVEDVIYLDIDGSNGKKFKDFTHSHNITYVKQAAIESVVAKIDDKISNKLIDKVFVLIAKIVNKFRKDNKKFKPTFIIDSLTPLLEGMDINNAEKISPTLYLINNFAEKFSIGFVLIDHATEIRDERGQRIGFKMEGNISAKFRTAVTVNRYEPNDISNPVKGGVFTAERTRGNTSDLSIGTVHQVASLTKDMALEWITKRQSHWLTEKVTKSDITIATKHNKDKWVRQFIDDLFIKRVENRITYYKYR